ncbi:MAG: putative porin [Planctomycetaceae bacterium]|nr:putative porin [Planctomycetaceae bacterium]
MKYGVAAVVLFALLAAPSYAQEEKSAPVDSADNARRLDQLEAELKEVKEELDRERRARERDDILGSRALTIYGDLGLRWQYTLTDGEYDSDTPDTNNTSRLEYRARLGAAGFIYDSDKHRLKYDLRIAAQGQGDYDVAPLGAPAVGWRPFDPLGASAEIAFDRWQLNHTYKQWLRVGAGRFGSIFQGTELIFDDDLGLAGGYGIVDVGILAGLYEPHNIDDWLVRQESSHGGVTHLQLRAAAYYLGQKETGLPVASDERRPVGLSLQAPSKMWLDLLASSLLIAPGFHYFDGEDAIAANIGTGNTFTTTATLDGDGTPAAKYRVGDLYLQLMFFEDRIAALKIYGHAARNFDAQSAPTSDSNRADGFIAGVEWGAIEFSEMGDFRLSYSFQYIEADAVIPEFNNDVFNTNYTGHMFSLQVNVLPGVTAFGSMYYGWRLVEEIGGVGRKDDGMPGNPSDDHETRFRVGITARF